jgi:ankyrin repeat protein
MKTIFAFAASLLLTLTASASKNDDWYAAIVLGNVERVKMQIREGADINAKFKDGIETPLRTATSLGYPEVVALLIQNGASLNAGGHTATLGRTLLHDAVASSKAASSDTIRILLDAGLSTEAKDKYGNTPLHVAIQQKHIEFAEILLNHGADPSAVGDEGPPMIIATSNLMLPDTSLAFVKLLISKGGDVKGVYPNWRSTALHNAARYNYPEVARILLAAGADPDAMNSTGESPRMLFKGSHGVDIDTLLPLTTLVNRYVQSHADLWLKKDEYESTTDYDIRMKGKKTKIGELMGEAFDQLGVWKSVEVGPYDADSETFKLTIRDIGDIIVPVPKARARDFKQKFASFAFKPQFAAASKGWTLSRLEMRGSGDDVFAYDSAKQANYKPVVFDVKTGAAVDTALAAGQEIKTEVRKVTVAAADDVSLIPKFTGAVRDADVAVVIGIETYRGLPKSAYSRGDAELMKRYLLALGFKERNIALLTDDKATYIDIKKTLETWLRNVAKPESSVFVYYSGHGAPEAATGEGYIVPFDGDPEYLQDTAYPLKKLVAGLNGLGAKQSVLVLDSCFSGMGGRSVLAKNARPLVAKAVGPVLTDGVAMMTASANDQISTSSEEFGHGVFTYYFLKAMKDGKKDLSEIYGYARPLVEDEARRQNARQSPTMMPSAEKAKGRFAIVR